MILVVKITLVIDKIIGNILSDAQLLCAFNMFKKPISQRNMFQFIRCNIVKAE